jgi:IS5 family transposase
MIRYSSGQGELFGHYVYGAVFRKRGHILKDLVERVDFSFVDEVCRAAWCEENGRPGWEPLKLFKVTVLQFLYDISDRRVEEEVAFSLIYRYFVGLDPSEEPPDHTTLCRFRKRLGPARFESLFNRVVTVDRSSPDKEARFGRKTPQKGFYGYKVHAVMDAGSELITAIQATPGNRPDNLELPKLVDCRCAALTGDKAYDSRKNRDYLAAGNGDGAGR